MNCKIVLWLHWLSPAPLAICSMERITRASQYLALLGFFPICNIIFQVIHQCRYFFQLCDKNLILKRSLTLNNTNTYVSSKKRVWVLQFWRYETKTFLIFLTKIFFLKSRQMEVSSYTVVWYKKVYKLIFCFSILLL